MRRSRRGWLALEAAPADREGHLSACASGGDALDPQITTQVAATVRTVLPDLLYSLLTEAWLRKAPKPVAAEPAFRLPTGAVAARSTSIRTSAAREVCGSWTAPVEDRLRTPVDRVGRCPYRAGLTSLPTSDRHCFPAGGRSDQTASSLRTGDQSALRVPAVPWGLLCRAGRPGVLLPVEVGPGFPWGSLVFLFCSFGASAGGLEWNAGHRSAAFAQVGDLWRWSG